MRKILVISLLMLALMAFAQAGTDPRSIQLMGIPIEGPIDSLATALQANEFTEWGQSDDGEDFYYRGNFYGFRAKLMISIAPESRLVQSAYVTIGPYSTQKMLDKNLNYFLYKMTKDHGEFTSRENSWFYIDDFGSIKMSVIDNDNGSRDIGILFLNTAPYYKDGLNMGLHGDVQEVVTENAVAEEQFLHFHGNGQIDNNDLVEQLLVFLEREVHTLLAANADVLCAIANVRHGERCACRYIADRVVTIQVGHSAIGSTFDGDTGSNDWLA